MDAETPHYHGHRERLRSRFRDDNHPERWQDYEILELLLMQSIQRRDVKPLAKALLQRFKGFRGVLAAPPHLLKEVEGIGPKVAEDFKLFRETVRRFAQAEIDERPVLGSFSSVIDYCRLAMAHEAREQFRVLFLDRKNHLIRDEVQQFGTVDFAPVFPREIVRRAVDLSASALILAHNHPSGDPAPSDADKRMTRELLQVAATFDIVIHDHIIVGRDAHFSFRQKKLI